MKSIQRTYLTLFVLVLVGCVTADEKTTITQVEALGARVLYVAKDAKEYSVTITKDLFGKDKGFTVEEAKLLGGLANAVEISLQSIIIRRANIVVLCLYVMRHNRTGD